MQAENQQESAKNEGENENAVNVDNSNTKVGWIGLGVMGNSMARHLINKGYNVSINTRTKSKAENLIQLGATYFDNPQELAAQVDYVFLMVGYPADVESLIYSEDKGILNHMKPNSILIDHTSSSPGLAIRIAKDLDAKGIKSIDAPVSGGDIGAQNGQLVVMCGGDKKAFEQAKTLMDCYSAQCLLMGEAGAGHHTKMANQIMVAASMIGVCEALIYGHKAGIQLDQMIELLKGGAAGSFTLMKLGPRMLNRNFEPGFYVEHFVKDLGIVLEESQKMNISLPGTALAKQFYVALVAQGGSKMGTQGLLTTLEKFNNVNIPKY